MSIQIGLLLFPLVLRAQPTLSGQIINDVTGFGIAGIDLDVFDTAGKSVTLTSGISGSGGFYQLELPGAGVYTVRADPSRADFFVDVFYNQVFLKSQATPITVEENSAATNINFRLRTGFQILGKVWSGTVPLANIDLDLYAETGEFLDGYPATTLADGSYAIGALPPGSYYLKADPDPSVRPWFVPAYYGGAFLRSHATPIVISASDVTGIDIHLQPGGMIQGRVTARETGLALAAIDLDLFDGAGAWEPFGGSTGLDGTYLLGPVPVGSHRVRVTPTLALGYARTYYAGVYFLDAATAVPVTQGQVSTNIDFVLDRGGAISGRIVDADTGLGLGGIDLDVLTAAHQFLDVTTRSLPDGTYVMGPLPAGQYLLRADPTVAQGYVRSYYPGTPFDDLGGLIGVVAGTTTSNVDFTLGRAGSISGRIRDAVTGSSLAAIHVNGFDATGRRLDILGVSGPDGSYLLGPLPPGPCYVRAHPGATQGYQVQYYREATVLSNAAQVLVGVGVETTNVDFNLLGAGWLAGSVRDAGQQPLAGIDLDIYLALTGERVRLGDTTEGDGTFVIGPLAPGGYKLRADPTLLQGYALEYFDNKPNQALADEIVVQAGVGTTGIVFVLERGGSLSGQVTSLASGAPLTGMDLDVFLAGTMVRLDQSAQTDLSGNFTLGRLAAGTYLLRADPLPDAPLIETYYVQAPIPAEAQPITLAAGEQKLGLNIQVLPRGGLSSPVLEYRWIAPDRMELTFPTQVGASYWLEYAPTVPAARWDVLATGPGTGTRTNFVDTPLPRNGSRFYRLRLQ